MTMTGSVNKQQKARIAELERMLSEAAELLDCARAAALPAEQRLSDMKIKRALPRIYAAIRGDS